MKHKMKVRVAAVAHSLEGSRTDVPLALKLKTAEAILRLMDRKRHKHFGLFVILGWRRKWQGYLDISDSKQDIFAKHHIDVMRDDAANDVAATIDFDGAILIDPRGTVLHSGVFIEGLRPRVVAQKINPGKYKDLSEQFGFETKVHARHLSAITASFVFRGTTVFTVSEENDSFHVFEFGRIVHFA